MRSKFQQEADGTPELRRFKTVLFAKVWEGVGKPYEVVQKPGANGRGAVNTTQPEGPGGRGLGDLRRRPIRTALPGQQRWLSAAEGPRGGRSGMPHPDSLSSLLRAPPELPTSCSTGRQRAKGASDVTHSARLSDRKSSEVCWRE